MGAKPNTLRQAIRCFAHLQVSLDAAAAIAIAGALLLAAVALAPRALAQNNSNAGACAQAKQDAVAQIQSAYNALWTGLQNEETDAETTKEKAKIACGPVNNPPCVKKADDQYDATMKTIEGKIIDLEGSERKAMNIAYAGTCAPSAADLAQLISAMGQAAGQVAQGTAQIINSTKGKGTGSGTSGQSSQTGSNGKPQSGGSNSQPSQGNQSSQTGSKGKSQSRRSNSQPSQ